ncbi:hypothetical protein [Azospirillum sp.]|uniref:hypothetical protein n=1 Tax=Azospirillum sp. TaxID=34012 RepID=UPI002D5C4195|nr:hypothetical protein [Azospirillum sp.]HYD64567.1 hypothetical protein [Azospirillum sp.]
MALVKPVPTDFGIDATYWNILAVENNRPQQAARVMMAGFASAQARTHGHQPLATVLIDLAGADYPGTADGIAYPAIYEAIKARAAAPGGTPPFTLFAQATDG